MTTTPRTASTAPAGTSPPAKFHHVRAGEGDSYWLNGDVYTVKIGAPDSSGSLALIEASVPPGGGPPLHTHENEDEAFYLLAGQLDIYAGDAIVNASAGDFVFIPRRTAHRFHNTGLHPARQLLLFTPGGFEGFFAAVGTRALPGVAVPPFSPENNERAVEIGAEYGSFQV